MVNWSGPGFLVWPPGVLSIKTSKDTPKLLSQEVCTLEELPQLCEDTPCVMPREFMTMYEYIFLCKRALIIRDEEVQHRDSLMAVDDVGFRIAP